MALITGLALTLVSFAPQGDGQEPLTVLSTSDIRSLNNKVKAWFEVWFEREQPDVDTATRRRLQPSFQKNKDAFMRDWENKQKKVKVDDLLRYVDDLRGIFENAFPYKRQSTSGDVKRIKPRNSVPDTDPYYIPEYDLVAPRNYNQRNAYRTMVVVPGFVNGEWESGEDHFDATWRGSKIASETIFMMPDLSDDMDLDPPPTGAVAGRRNAAMMLPMADLQTTFRMDRSRLILDAGKEASGWGLRFATYFPSRFAGLVLRDPVDPGELRLDSITGVPVLLIRRPDNAEAVVKIETTLNTLAPGSCTVIEVSDEYPHKSAQGDIEAWVENVERDLFRKKVVLAPNSDSYNDGYWVKIIGAEPMEFLPADQKPKLVVEADRNTNRIEVEAVNVSDFELMLNDALVDLDKEITVVINGKATTQKRSRSLSVMSDLLFQSFDPTWIFTTRLTVAVAKDGQDGR